MSELERIFGKYTKDEVAAALPVIFLVGSASAPSSKMSAQLTRKIADAARTIGVGPKSTPEQAAAAIASYCAKQNVSAALLNEVAQAYREQKSLGLLEQAATRGEEGQRFLDTAPEKNAPKASDAAPTKKPVKAKRGLSKK